MVTSGLIDCTVGTNAEGISLTLNELYAMVTEATVDPECHELYSKESGGVSNKMQIDRRT